MVAPDRFVPPTPWVAEHWGSSADLIDILNVSPDIDGGYSSVVRGNYSHRPVAEGSQLLGQSIVACCKQFPKRRVVSAHMVFVRGADALQPLRFELERLSHGRTFTTLCVRAGQGGRLCATGTFLLDTTAPDVIRHSASAPTTEGPQTADPYDMGVEGRELRIVGGAYTGNPNAPIGPPVLDTWVRFASVPPDQPIHAALCAQFTGHMSIAAALRPHAGIGQDSAHRTLSTAINAISISFHAPVNADRWMRYHHVSTFAGDGMTHSECRVYEEAGTLIASFSVDAMVRAFPDDRPRDDRTAM